MASISSRPLSSSETTSRKGGKPHTLREWFTAPLGIDPSLPTPDRVSHRSISIEDWTITTSRGAIGNSAYMEKLADDLALPPPEMVFPSNTVVVTHAPTGFQYRFEVEKAIKCTEGVNSQHKMQGIDFSADWRSAMGSASASGSGSQQQHRRRDLGEKPQKKKNKGIKVAYADEWGKSRSEPSTNPAMTSASSEPAELPTTAFGPAAATQIAEARDYDWTYSTTWPGEDTIEPSTATHGSSSSSDPPKFRPGLDPAVDRIPVERLGPSSGEPILFYDDLVLFEDELGDNGSSMLGVKIRVMPSGFLILQRFLLRVDDVVFRLFDTRMFCSFDEGPIASSTTTTAAPSMAPTSATAVPPPAAAPWAKPTDTARPTSSAIPDLGKLALGQPRRANNNGTQASQTTAPSFQPAASSSSSCKLIRECSGCEAPYKDVKSRLPPYRPNDLSLLTDPGWVSQTLQNLTARQYAQRQQQNGNGSSVTMAAGGVATQAVAPARLPGSVDETSIPSGSVLGEIGDEDVWEGVGGRVDVIDF